MQHAKNNDKQEGIDGSIKCTSLQLVLEDLQGRGILQDTLATFCDLASAKLDKRFTDDWLLHQEQTGQLGELGSPIGAKTSFHIQPNTNDTNWNTSMTAMFLLFS